MNAIVRVDPATEEVQAFPLPAGSGRANLNTASFDGGVLWFTGQAGVYGARIDAATKTATPIDSPTPGLGARRIWSDSQGRIWVSEWNAGQLGMYDPSSDAWREWRLPGNKASTTVTGLSYNLVADSLDNTTQHP